MTEGKKKKRFFEQLVLRYREEMFFLRKVEKLNREDNLFRKLNLRILHIF